MDWYLLCQEGPPCLIQFAVAVGLLILGWLLLSNSGPSLPSQIGKKISINADTASTRSRGDLDSDSDEDGDLFGSKREPSFTSGNLHSSTQPPPTSKKEKSGDLFADINSHTPTAPVKSSVGVENVRAIPNPTRTGIPGTSRPQNNSSNLFASDTDDEGDLFSSKPLSSAKTKSQNSKVKNQPEQSTTAASGLFSSDEDGGLFSAPTVKTQGIINSGEDHEQKEEPPSLPQSTGKKVPVGGINVFGSAITSAIHQQQSSESEPSHDEGSNQEISRTSSVSLSKPEPPPLKQSATHKTASSGGHGLFDDDEEEDLFGSIVKKPVTASLETKTGQKKPVLPVSSDTIKKPDGEGTLPRNEVVADTSSITNVIKSTGGLFSDDDDDDLFGIPAKVESRPSTLPILPATGGSNSTKKASETNSVVSNAKHDGQFDSDSAVTSTESQSIQISDPVKVPDPPKTLSSSLFSSPSDDDDLFSPSSRFPSTKSASAFMTEPPPLPPPSTSKPSHVISGSPIHQDSFSPSTQPSLSQVIKEPSTIDQISSKTSVKVKAEQRAEGLPSNNRFSPPSDDDLFSSSSKTIHEDVTATQKTEERIESRSTLSEPTKASENVAPDTTTNASSHKFEPEHKIPISPDENLFTSKTEDKVDLTKEGAKPPTSSKTEMPAEKSNMQTSSDNSGDDIFSDALSRALSSKKVAVRSDKKESGLLGVSDDEDIFATTQRETKSMPYENAKDGEDIVSTSVKQSQHQKDPVPAKVTKSDNLANISSETSVRDRESPPTLPSDAESAKVPQTSQSEIASVSKPEKPAEVVKKPPVGGVALFGGAELAAQVSKRKSMLSPEEAKDKEVQEERSTSTPHIEKPVLEEENIDSISKSNIFDGESDDDDLFGISQVKSERSYSQFSRFSPPPLPTETEKSPSMHSQEPESSSSHIQEGPKTADTKLPGVEVCFPGESELPIDKKSKTKDLNESSEGKNKVKSDKTEQSVIVEKESRETKPHKKPPVGGVSLFGGGVFGGSELLAKVQQRKSMLAPESESDEDDSPSNSPSSSPAKKENAVISPRKNVTPVSPVSPVSPLSPVFGSEPLVPKSGGQEKSVSFDEPTTTSTTLQSLNKSRVRGSQRRRPPSRAHRRGGLGENDPSILPNNGTGIEYTAPPQTIASSSVKHTSPSPSTASQSEQSLSSKKQRLSKVNEDRTVVANASSAVANEPNEVDSMFVDNDPEVDIFGKNTVNKITNVENNEKSAETSAKEESKFVALKDNSEDMKNDLFGNSISALNSSKISSSKGSSKSIFGGNDSDDEDLFGQTKPKTSLLKSTGSSALQNSGTKSVAKPPSAQSLFEDDDDDIFSSASKAEKASASVPRKVPASKSKSNLKPSSEPFEDPLLGNLK